MAAIDPVTAQAIQEAIHDDDAFKRIVKKIAIEGLQKLHYYLKYGTPDQQVRIATQLSKVYQAALEKGDDDEPGRTIADEARELLLSVMNDGQETD